MLQKKSLPAVPCVNRCGRNKAKRGSYCYTCRRARYRDINPIAYAFDNLRQNAKRRGIKFLLTLEDFIDFLKEFPEYMFKKGRGKNDLTIDRKIDPLGYAPGNLQVLTNADNVRKKNKTARGWSNSVPVEGRAEFYKDVPF